MQTIKPNWPAPNNILAYTTLRTGGVSKPPYGSFNLGDHVGDNEEAVANNREQLQSSLHLSMEPIWIRQTHSTIAIEALPQHRFQEADAAYTHQTHHPCIVLTADCLPILLCHRLGTHVAAIHAGWRGLANGVIESTLAALNLPPEDLLIWLGPAISVMHYEVGNEVRDIFLRETPTAEHAFLPSPNQRWFADMYEIARARLQQRGITQIYGGDYCTYRDKELFYSYRRDGGKTGRMASLIWLS